jgi:methylenetetrahydrofolate--tRNA-(uracil-5-)-methyltransferase
MLGGLYRYLRESDPHHFQPMNSNWGLVDPLPDRIRDKRKRRETLADRAQEDFQAWMAAEGIGGGSHG